MRLLLRKKVPGLGVPGDVVDIADGYGRNYLIPQRLGVANTPGNRQSIESEKLEWLQREAERNERAKQVAKQLKNALLQVHMKAKEDGTLYGSVTPAIARDVIKNTRGLDVEDRWIRMEEPIKKIGDYDIPVHLPADAGDITFKLTVLPETS